jgi:hypothetical protein
MCTKRNEALHTVQNIAAGRQISGPREYLLRQDQLQRIDNQKTAIRFNLTEDVCRVYVTNTFPPTLQQAMALKNKFQLFVLPLDENRLIFIIWLR